MVRVEIFQQVGYTEKEIKMEAYFGSLRSRKENSGKDESYGGAREVYTFLEKIRRRKTCPSMTKQIIHTALVLCAGILMGVLGKYLDCTSGSELPYFVEYLDVGNFLGRCSIWIFLAVCISVYSSTALRAAINVFLFFLGMVSSYYLYSNFVAGFFPRSYAMIWFGLTMISPLLAFLCWYAKGEGVIAMTLSAGIIAVLFSGTFTYGFVYFDLRSPLELLVLLGGFAVLRRPAKEMAVTAAAGVVFSMLLRVILPFGL